MQIALAILSSGVISTLISCIFQIVSDRKKKLSRFEEGMKLLLLSDIRSNGKRLIEQGKVTREEHQIFIASYNAYKALGGDGWADSVKAKVEALQVDFED